MAVALAAPVARAGNLDTFFLSNDAATIGGAATATAKSAGALWYNPAGLTETTGFQVDVNATAYLIRFGGSPDLTAPTGVAASRRKLTTLDLVAVPTALAVARSFGRTHVSIGVFSPNRVTAYPRTSIAVRDASGTPVETTLDGNSRYTEYYGGIGFGYAVTDTLSFGATAFGVYTSDVNTLALSSHRGEISAPLDTLVLHTTRDELRLGVQLVWGLRWVPTPRTQVGLVFRSPTVQVFDQVQGVTVLGTGTAAPSSGAAPGTRPAIGYFLDFSGDAGLRSQFLRPMRAHLGVAHTFGKVEVAADGSLQAPSSGSGVPESTRAVANARLGVRGPVGKSTTLGGGVFTDRSPTKDNAGALTGSLNYYGGSLGLELSSLYRVRSEDDAKERPLVMSTTVAVAYMIGTGRLGNLTAAPGEGGGLVLGSSLERVVAHEIMIHVGSTLSN